MWWKADRRGRGRGPPAHPAEPALYWHHYLLRSGFPLLQSEVGWEIHLLVSALSNLYAKCKCGKEGKGITVINREQMEVKQVLTNQNPTLTFKVYKALTTNFDLIQKLTIILSVILFI